MVDRPMGLVVTDPRRVGFRYEEGEAGLSFHALKFRPRFGLDQERVQEIRF